jgi:hypothetical protein
MVLDHIEKFKLLPETFSFLVFFPLVLEIEPRASAMLGKYPTTELYHEPFCLLKEYIFFADFIP